MCARVSPCRRRRAGDLEPGHGVEPADRRLRVDGAEAPAGELLVFEADTAMVVHAMDSLELFPYKRPAMRRVFKAFQDMLRTYAGRSADRMAAPR